MSITSIPKSINKNNKNNNNHNNNNHNNNNNITQFYHRTIYSHFWW